MLGDFGAMGHVVMASWHGSSRSWHHGVGGKEDSCHHGVDDGLMASCRHGVDDGLMASWRHGVDADGFRPPLLFEFFRSEVLKAIPSGEWSHTPSVFTWGGLRTLSGV